MSKRKTRRSRRGSFQWQRFWKDLGLGTMYKSVTKSLHKSFKKWPYEKEYSHFLGFFGLAAVLAIFMTGTPHFKPIAFNGKKMPGKMRVYGTNSVGVSTFASNTPDWSKWVMNAYEGGKWNDSTFKNFGRAPAIQDTAPLLSKTLDCTTYVETVGALARSSSYADFYKNLIQIRYNGGHTGFENRNHFPEADWIPNNEDAGILADITEAIANSAGAVTHVEKKTIDKNNWVTKQAKRGGVTRTIASNAQKKWESPVNVKLAYIPLSEIDKVSSHIPNGAIINLVRSNNPEHDVLVGHQGFFIRENGKAMFRHSTTTGKVQTVPLKWYLGVQQKKHWPLVGINVNAFKPSQGASFQPPR